MSPTHNRQRKLTITVIIVTRDRPEHLARAVRSLLGQTVKPDEILIVDSSEHEISVREIVSKYAILLPIRIIRTGKQSIPDKRGIGVKFSKGIITAFLDDDVEAPPTYLESVVRHLTKNSLLSAVMGRQVNGLPDNVYASTLFSYYDRGLRSVFPSLLKPGLLNTPRIADCALLGIRTPVIKQLGFPHRADGYRQDDMELVLRLLKNGKRILYDPNISGISHPRETFFQLLSIAFREGYWAAFVAKTYNTYPGSSHDTGKPFIPWVVNEILSNKTYSSVKKMWFGILLVLYPLTGKAGNVWFRLSAS